MIRSSCIASIVAAMIAFAGPAAAKTIMFDNGGVIVRYIKDVDEARRSGDPVTFAGPCNSACTLYLSLPVSQLCIQPTASFGFHAAQHPRAEVRRQMTDALLRKYPAWAKRWIDANGGLTTREIVMPASYAQRYLPSCR